MVGFTFDLVWKIYRWLPDGHGQFAIDEDRQATEQDVVNITDTEYKGFWISVNEVSKYQLFKVFHFG